MKTISNLVLTLPTLATCLVIGLLTASLAPLADAKPRQVNGIAAIANGRVVTLNEVSFILAPIRAQIAMRHPRMGNDYHTELAKSKKKVLDELIDRQLIIQEFNDMGAQIPDHAVKADIKRHIDRIYDGSETKFRQQLKETDLSYTKFFKLTKDKLIGQAMRAQHFNDPTPATQEELVKAYNKIKKDLRDRSKDKINFEKIYIPVTNEDDLLATPESQKKFAEELVEKIKNGADFAALAKEHSTDAFADQGGKQINVKRTDLRPDLSFVLFTEPLGTVIGPIRLDEGGYQIFRVTKKIEGPAPGLSEVRDEIEQSVQNKKSSVRFKRFIDRLRKKALIKYK